MTVREFELDKDVEAVVALLADVYPHGLVTTENFAHRTRSAPARARRRGWVAEADGAVVGWATSALDLAAGRDDVATLAVAVAPSARRRGIGSALYDRAEAHLVALRARKLLSHSEDSGDARRFAERRGFRHTHSLRYFAVDPRTVDTDLSELRERAERDGLRLAPVTEVPAEPVWEADMETSRDMPSDEPFATMPFHEWKAMVWDNPQFARDASYVVLDGDRVAALTMLRIDAATARAGTDMTGTRREYRGRGLARLVKLASLRRAADRGVTRVVTDNDEQNAPMLAVNRRLGFTPYSAALTWVRE